MDGLAPNKNSRSSAQPGTQPHKGVQATVTPAPDAEPPPGSGQNTGVAGTTHAVADNQGQTPGSPGTTGPPAGASARSGTRTPGSDARARRRRRPAAWSTRPRARTTRRRSRPDVHSGRRRGGELDLRRHGDHRGDRRTRHATPATTGRPTTAPRLTPSRPPSRPPTPRRPSRSPGPAGTSRSRRPRSRSGRPAESKPRPFRMRIGDLRSPAPARDGRPEGRHSRSSPRCATAVLAAARRPS